MGKGDRPKKSIYKLWRKIGWKNDEEEAVNDQQQGDSSEEAMNDASSKAPINSDRAFYQLEETPGQQNWAPTIE